MIDGTNGLKKAYITNYKFTQSLHFHRAVFIVDLTFYSTVTKEKTNKKENKRDVEHITLNALVTKVGQGRLLMKIPDVQSGSVIHD